MPKPKWNLNTIYISERLQESLRPISRCAMTTVVAPMGYGKTTAVNWYLGEHAKAEALHIIRISVYSDNLAIFWKSVQEAFARAGFNFLREYPCPTDKAFRCAGGKPSLFQRGLVFCRVSEPAHPLRARRAAQPKLRYLRHFYRRYDRSAAGTAAGVSGGHGACR